MKTFFGKPIFFMVLLCTLSKILPAQTLKIYHIYVGQGDATLIVARHPDGKKVSKTVLIDGGGKAVYGQNIIKYIKDTLGIDTLNYVITSHYDYDHYGGLIPILEHGLNNKKDSLYVDTLLDRGDKLYPNTKLRKDKTTNSYKLPDSFIEYKSIASKYKNKNRRKTLITGNKITLYNGYPTIEMRCICVNGVVITKYDKIIDTLINKSNPNENDLSTGFILTFGMFEYVTCGDIGGKSGKQGLRYKFKDNKIVSVLNNCHFTDIETSIVFNYRNVSAYKVNHHGSSCSSNKDWISYMNAKVAFISSGDQSHYCHPQRQVTEALDANKKMKNYFFTDTVDRYKALLNCKNGILNKTDNSNKLKLFPVILTVAPSKTNDITQKTGKFNVQVGGKDHEFKIK
jgi:competence protein ComEC